MNYNSVIKPDAMISQCNEMLLMFEQDNDSIQTVWNAFSQFIGDSEIESEAFHALKQRVSDYLTVLQSMKIANEMDIGGLQELFKADGSHRRKYHRK